MAPARAQPPPARIPHHVAVRVADAWRAARDAEPCGYLLGRSDARGRWQVRAAVPGRNRHPSPASGFQLRPNEMLAVQRAARRRGLRVVGTWHGHLLGPPTAGRADRAALMAPAAPPLMLIAGRGPAGDVALAAYEARGGRIRRARLSGRRP